MKKIIQKGTEEWQFFKDFYSFRQEYHEPEDSDEWFERFIDRANKLYKKYEQTELKYFTLQIILAHVNDIDRRCRGK